MRFSVLRSAYNYDTMAASDECAITCSEPSLARQEFKDEADINFLLEKYGVLGITPSDVPVVTDVDFSEAPDFMTCMNLQRKAVESFESMPAKVRSRFGNDPVQFVEFCSDAENVDEMVKLGLAVKRPLVEAPTEAVEPLAQSSP